MAAAKSLQADMVAWNPEHDRSIRIEFKRYSPLRAQFTLAHELGHLTLSHSDTGQANATAKDDLVERLAYERLVAMLLADFKRRGAPFLLRPASRTAGASEGLSNGLRPAEPAWMSWARDRFESHLRRLPTQIPASAPTAHDQTIRQRGSVVFDAIADRNLYSWSVTFGTTGLARDYRAARIHLVGSVFAALRLIRARLVSAFAHRPNAPAFLLIMLATARRYGHRSEPDHLSLLASVLEPPQPMGAACLVT
jgi:hypothetical protein